MPILSGETLAVLEPDTLRKGKPKKKILGNQRSLKLKQCTGPAPGPGKNTASRREPRGEGKGKVVIQI